MRVKKSAGIVLILLVLATAVAAGCGLQNQEVRKPEQPPGTGIGDGSEEGVTLNPGLAEIVKKQAQSVKEVEDSAAVVVNKDISVAIKAGGFNRLRLRAIKGEVDKKIREVVDRKHFVHITSDSKLFFQLRQLENQIRAGKAGPAKDVKLKVNKINDNMQD